jgi:hypothetical protein
MVSGRDALHYANVSRWLAQQFLIVAWQRFDKARQRLSRLVLAVCWRGHAYLVDWLVRDCVRDGGELLRLLLRAIIRSGGALLLLDRN